MLNIGLSENDIKKFSILNIVRSGLNNRVPEFEREVSDTVVKKSGLPARGFWVPADVLQKRDITPFAIAGGTGGYLVEEKLTSFVDILANKMLVRKLGATILPGLTSDISIPALQSGVASYWVTEGVSPTEGLPVFGQLPMSPKTIAGFVDATRKLVMQSSIGIEQFLRMDLARSLALGVDLAAIKGGGSGEPDGIFARGDIPTYECGTPDGGGLTYQGLCLIESTLGESNADVGALGFLTNSKVRALLRSTPIFTNSEKPCWEGSETDPSMGRILGMPAGATSQVPSNFEKGSSGATLSGLIFGNWSDFLIGEFGPGLDILTDPFSLSTSGGLRVVAFLSCDFVIKHPASFCKVSDINTALPA